MVKLLHHRPAQSFDFAALLGRRSRLRLNRGDVAYKVLLTFSDAIDSSPLLPLHQHLDRAVGQLEHLQDGGHAAHGEHVFGRGLVLGCGLLGHQHDAPLGLHGRLQRLDALGSPDKQRDDHVRKDHDIAQWQHRQVN